jgi:hypothetical protein
MARTDELAAKIARVERVVAFLGAERYGLVSLGPMDISWRSLRQQVIRDIASIMQEHAEAQRASISEEAA